MRLNLDKFEWQTAKGALRVTAWLVFASIGVALAVPRTRDFLLGMAFSLSGILAMQLLRKKPFQEAEEMPDPLTSIHLR